MTGRTTRFEPFAIALVLLAFSGCGQLRYYNTTDYISGPARTYEESWTARFMKNNYYYPVRDAFDPHVWASLIDPNQPPAWDVDESGNVPEGSFFSNRPIERITPDQAARGATLGLEPPKPPWTVKKVRRGRTPASFVAADATGRKFLVKLDDEQYPEAGTAAAIISSRIFHLLGYHVPPNWLVTIKGTGNGEYDGKRAEASLFIPGRVLGHYKFDWLRYRREFRALRLAAAWLDDLDRSDNNTLVTLIDGRSYFYLIDFDSTLGLWHGRPKQPWQGHRHLWDPPWALAQILTFGALSRCRIKHAEPFSRSVGVYYGDDFDPLAWKPHHPNSAFRLISQADARWMARRISRITDEQLAAIVEVAKLSRPADRRHLLRTLSARRDKIVRRFGPTCQKR